MSLAIWTSHYESLPGGPVRSLVAAPASKAQQERALSVLTLAVLTMSAVSDISNSIGNCLKCILHMAYRDEGAFA